MLQIDNIRKEYRTGNLVQQALDGVSLNFRDNEFVAILGPSGSGKTTLLNIIGGLDQYDSGDLIINGTSTKRYKDRDWDSYRNHTIGFVFQSYNLIPHQTILQNVELALTISGITSAERTQKATDALIEVGLGDHIHKKPSQLSGGQMQRVAIARALVNNPDILLADEPTGALDSKTSVQVMDLLKEVAADRLVVMVTHNPELAYEYANRIVELKDGNIISDSNPFVVDSDTPAVHRNLGRASMNFLTALSLSFNNLKTKLARTVLVAFAGSIGIIGIAMILSLSTGVDDYIKGIEESTIKEYPLTIDSTSFDMSAMFAGAGVDTGDEEDEEEAKKKEAEVKELQTITSMFSMMTSNDLKSLKTEIDSGKSGIQDYTRAIEYTYNISPQLFRKNGEKFSQVNPDMTRQKMGVSYNISGSFSSMMNSNVFHALPSDPTLYEDEYELKAGHWPKNYNECIVVLTEHGYVSDLALYAMGLKDMDELDDMLSDFREGKDVKPKESNQTFDYNDMMGVEFKLINNADYYTYDSGNGVWVSKQDNDDYMYDIIAGGDTVKIVGVVQPKEGTQFTTLSNDIYYPESLTQHIIAEGQDSEIVKAQKKDKKTNVLTGKPFGEDSDGVDFGSLFSVDQNAMKNAFKFDTKALQNAMKAPKNPDIDLENIIDPADMQALMPELSAKDLLPIIQNSNIEFTEENMSDLFNALMQGFLADSAAKGVDYTKVQTAFADYLQSDAASKIIADDLKTIVEAQVKDKLDEEDFQEVLKDILGGFPEYYKSNYDEDPAKLEDAINAFVTSDEVSAKISSEKDALVNKLSDITLTDEQAQKISGDLLAGYAAYASENNLPDVANLSDEFAKYLETPAAQAIILKAASSVDTSELEKNMSQAMGTMIFTTAGKMAEKIVSAIMSEYMSSMGGALDFSKVFSVNTDAFANALSMNMNEDDITALMQSLMSGGGASTYKGNLEKFGYANINEPVQIAIYAKDFESKGEIKDKIEAYNERQRKNDNDDKVVQYNDIAGALMGSVTDIIDAISYVLIAFVSISLIVSSIMIGVITYISVLERRKEIGILRAIGASKNNISQVFNAETFIIGALAGIFGIVITEILLIPTNMIIDHVTTANIRAFLPPAAAILLILLSIVLTLIGGIIPSRKAAKSDPVTALRVD